MSSEYKGFLKELEESGMDIRLKCLLAVLWFSAVGTLSLLLHCGLWYACYRVLSFWGVIHW